MAQRTPFYWQAPARALTATRKLLPQFETKAQAEERNAKLCRSLQYGTAEHHQVRERLLACQQGQRCDLVLCALCRRQYRLWLVGEMLAILKPYELIWFVTLIPADAQLPPGKLAELKPRRLIERVKRQLERKRPIGKPTPTDVVAIGNLDLSSEADGDRKMPDYWQPHLHLIIAGCSKADLEAAFAGRYLEDSTVAQPVRIIKVTNPRASVFAYCCKPFVQQRVRWRLPNETATEQDGEQRTRRVALKSAQLHELALAYGNMENNDLRLMLGVRQHGTKLKLTTSDK